MKVWVVSFGHKYGTSTYVFAHMEDAEKAPARWAASWWSDHVDDSIPDPMTKEDVDHYFEEAGESYSVEEEIVRPSIEDVQFV